MPYESTASSIKTPQEAQAIESSWIPSAAESERGLRIHSRIDEMLEYRFPHELAWKRSVLNYEGVSREHPLDPREQEFVAPFSYIFVEAKTAEEMRGSRDYVFTAVEDAGDEWKVELLQSVKRHADRRRNMRSLKHRAYRYKNLFGNAVIRTGYRRTMRWIKEREMNEEDAVSTSWKKRYVPVYDDLFAELLSPFNFAVDPNATCMNDAEDCVHFHVENWSIFQEIYANDKRFMHVEHVKPGIFHRFGGKPFARSSPGKNQILVAEYFNKIRDEWVIYANGIEIYPGDVTDDAMPGLPDDHKELPFVSLHNSPSFVQTVTNTAFKSPNSGQDAIGGGDFEPQESFYGKGDPEIIRDLIDLRTGFGRAMFRAAKLAGETILATSGNITFDTKTPWKTGRIAVNALGKIAPIHLGSNNTPNFQFVFDDLLNLMILCLGVDPRNLTEGKIKTATEAQIQRETAMRRLQQNIEYNDDVCWVRLGRLDLGNFQQYYSIPELKRLTGREDISKFDDVEKDSTGKPIFGKRYRRIHSTRRLKERKRKLSDGTYKFYLSESEEGAWSFLSRPEYIRSSEIDVALDSTSTIDQIRSVNIEQSMKALEILLGQIQLIPAGLAKLSDMPKLRFVNMQLVKSLGWSTDEAMGKETEEEEEELPAPPPIPINPPLLPMESPEEGP